MNPPKSKTAQYLEYFPNFYPLPIGNFINRSNLNYRSAKIVLGRLVARGYLRPTAQGWVRVGGKS